MIGLAIKNGTALNPRERGPALSIAPTYHRPQEEAGADISTMNGRPLGW
jgi:hypothetical protein